jgi:hypothetical protein
LALSAGGIAASPLTDGFSSVRTGTVADDDLASLPQADAPKNKMARVAAPHTPLVFTVAMRVRRDGRHVGSARG